MTSLLMSKAKAKHTKDIPLITNSAENLGFCLNNMLKAGAVLASVDLTKDQASRVQSFAAMHKVYQFIYLF